MWTLLLQLAHKHLNQHEHCKNSLSEYAIWHITYNVRDDSFQSINNTDTDNQYHKQPRKLQQKANSDISKIHKMMPKMQWFISLWKFSQLLTKMVYGELNKNWNNIEWEK